MPLFFAVAAAGMPNPAKVPHCLGYSSASYAFTVDVWNGLSTLPVIFAVC